MVGGECLLNCLIEDVDGMNGVTSSLKHAIDNEMASTQSTQSTRVDPASLAQQPLASLPASNPPLSARLVAQASQDQPAASQ